ncbi:efflux RND transporter periplasmic adaptor subunit [Derxia gummosa]|uniref:Efflux RND transporter periplasmic adaptor subunit n=1 Tax=Derxia gummosa DSM 723 TaxID=1121388 RepID=A0A8B6X6B4_9BURK|nr:HlyD family efflux transporter periplasmic adaptor subunit [Derxia gummosa]
MNAADQRAPAATDRARELATLVLLMRRAREADAEDALGFVIVNETQRLLPYRQAALWRDGAIGALGRVSALSGLAETDPTAPYVQWLGTLFRALPRAGMAAADGLPAGGAVKAAAPGAMPATGAPGAMAAPGVPGATSGGTAAPPRALALSAASLPPDLAADWPHWLPAHALWLRLDPPGRFGTGALLLARDEPFTEAELPLATELANAYAHAQSRFAPQRGWRERAGDWIGAGRRRRWLIAAAVAIACMPVRMTVLARGEVVPEEPFLVRAPLTGVIDRIDVLPNQRVAAGAPLFGLDATALAGQTALARRAREAAEEAWRQSAQRAVTDDKGKLDMALDRARLDEKAIEAETTARQLDRLSVTAARAGVVVFSDRDDWVGRAVQVGEKVMTLADPAHVELAAWLPASESIRVAPGTRLTLYPNAAPGESYSATVTRVAWRAEPGEDGVLAFRLQARFDDGETPPRIGQVGTARVHGDWAPLAWFALRRPLTVARQWLGL